MAGRNFRHSIRSGMDLAYDDDAYFEDSFEDYVTQPVLCNGWDDEMRGDGQNNWGGFTEDEIEAGLVVNSIGRLNVSDSRADSNFLGTTQDVQTSRNYPSLAFRGLNQNNRLPPRLGTSPSRLDINVEPLADSTSENLERTVGGAGEIPRHHTTIQSQHDLFVPNFIRNSAANYMNRSFGLPGCPQPRQSQINQNGVLPELRTLNERVNNLQERNDNRSSVVDNRIQPPRNNSNGVSSLAVGRGNSGNNFQHQISQEPAQATQANVTAHNRNLSMGEWIH